MKYEQVKCNLCKLEKDNTIFTKEGFKIVKCSNCGLVYVNPRLKPDVLDEMYNKDEISPSTFYINNLRDDEKTFTKRLDMIEKYIKKGSLLEIGCSVGTLLNIAQKRGWICTGVEINKKAARHCKEKYNLNVIPQAIEKVKLQDNSYDLIVMNDLIEHVPDPLDTLKKAKKLLKDNGYLFIVTPNINSFISILSGKKWLHIKPDEHIYYFTPITIKNLLSKAGLKVIKIKYLGRVRNLDTIFYKSSTYSVMPYKIIKKLKIDKFLKKISLNLNVFEEMGIIARK